MNKKHLKSIATNIVVEYHVYYNSITLYNLYYVN